MIPPFFACFILHIRAHDYSTVVIHYGIHFLSSSHAHASVQGLYLVATAKIVKLLLATIAISPDVVFMLAIVRIQSAVAVTYSWNWS